MQTISDNENQTLQGQIYGSPMLNVPFLIGYTLMGVTALHPSVALVEQTVQNGKTGPAGTMPSALATGPELDAGAQYIHRAANPNAYKP